MVTNTSTFALKEDEIEIENDLELGLSIGGGYQRPENLKPTEKGPGQVQPTSNSHFDDSEADPCEKNHNNLQSCTRSSVSPSFISDAEPEIDPHFKRLIQAARRQEAKKKIEEKQKKKRMCKGQNEDNVNEFGIRERQSKRNKVGDDVAGSENIDDEIKNVNGKLNSEQKRYCNVFSNPMTYIASPICPAMPMPNQLPPLSCWVQSGAGMGSERNVIRPVAMSSSSTISENHSSSQQGGSSADARSHSNVSLPEENQKTDTKEREEDGGSFHLLESAESINKSTNHVDQAVSDVIEPSPSMPKEEPISETKPHHPSRNIVSTRETTPSDNTFRETERNRGKPPKPLNSKTNATPLPRMPCVSTTGNGPIGKTINGFLYRYTKSEVSIVCVCHGTPFSPAEFVEHAGGTDLSQPLRHITVIPSAFWP